MACWGEAAKGALSGAGSGATTGAMIGGPHGAAIGAAAGGVVGGASGLFSGNCKPSKQEVEFINRQATAHNIFLKDYADYASFAYDALKAGGFDPFGPQITTRADTSQTTERYSETQRQRPTITPEYAALESAFRKILEQRLANPTSLPQGYETAGIRHINDALSSQIQAERNKLASRGVPTGSVLGSPVERARASQVADFRINLPLLERELQNQDLAAAQGATAQFGLGRDTNTSGMRSALTNALMTMTAPPDYATAIGVFGPQGPQAPYSGKVDPKTGMPEYGNEGYQEYLRRMGLA